MRCHEIDAKSVISFFREQNGTFVMCSHPFALLILYPINPFTKFFR